MSQETRLTINGLHWAEFYELEEQLPGLEQLTDEDERGTDHGTMELVTAVVSLAAAGVPLLTAWLTARQARTTHPTGIVIEPGPNGSVTIHLHPLAPGTAAPATQDPEATAVAIAAALRAHLPSTPE
ncbi:hypothetical protein [Streptomyces bicolor]|uniref:hypothetical protein n=1 Tax=Streptomyces bicolor TaxID=66874 RepID=UPI0004E17CDE|nr:hypothetical protein [Streptomyces bicolor]